MTNLLYRISKKIKFGLILSGLKIFYYVILNNFSKYPKYVLNFEKKIAKKFNSKFSLTFTNGTTACQSSIIALGVKKGSHVLVSKLTFPSIISTILRIGAIPIYLDFDKNLQIKFDVNDKLILDADFLLITHVYGIAQDYDKINIIKKINPKIILLEEQRVANEN